MDSLAQLMRLLSDHGVARVYVKELAANDNSKNQIYLGGDFSSLNIVPFSEMAEDESVRAGSKRARIKAAVEFYWLYQEGLYRAAGANLILYPRYPEVRLSGLLTGASRRPSELINSRMAGRLLFLGIAGGKRVIGFVTLPDSAIAREWRSLGTGEQIGVFTETSTSTFVDTSTRQELLARLREVHELGWISSQRRNSVGQVVAYRAANGGGYTLESMLGITPNGFSEPDFLGWEVKQFGVKDFDRYLASNSITLMTPEPTRGDYADRGVDWFLRRYGYEDQRGRPDRLNFGGIYRAGSTPHRLTGLSLVVTGYDPRASDLIDLEGGIALVSEDEHVAAMWPHRALLLHWKRKHAKAVYVPSLKRSQPLAYRYGSQVELGEQTDFLRFLNAVSNGLVFFDPGIKLEHASSSNPRLKRRSQFRVRQGDLPALYERYQIERLL